MARVSTQDGPKSETLDQAFNAASPAPSSNLPNVQPHGFESTTKIRPSQSGVSGSAVLLLSLSCAEQAVSRAHVSSFIATPV